MIYAAYLNQYAQFGLKNYNIYVKFSSDSILIQTKQEKMP